MSDTLDNLLMLIIFATYCRLLVNLAFIAGQLLILVVEYAADWLERRLERAGKQAQAMPYSKALDYKGTRRPKRG